MHRIDGYGATAENLFTEGDAAQGIPPTRVTDDWLSDIQENVARLLEAAGVVLSKNDYNQLADLFTVGGGMLLGAWCASSDLTIVDHGATTSAQSLKSISNSIDTDPATIELFPGTYPVGQDIVIGDAAEKNITYRPRRGAILSHGANNVTINGTIEAGPWQIFSGTGTVTITGPQGCVYPEWWGVDGVADEVEINKALDTGFRTFLAGASYITAGPVKLDADGDSLVGQSMFRTVIQSGDDTNPVVEITCLHPSLQSLCLRYTSKPADTQTSAFGIGFGSGADNIAWGAIRNIYCHTVYGGMGDQPGFTGAVFNNVYDNIVVRNWSGYAFYFENDGSGDLALSWYANNNWTGGNQSAKGVCVIKGDHDITIEQLNLEHCVCSDQHPVMLGSGRLVVDSIHYEDITYTHGDPAAIEFVGTNGQVLVRNILFNSVVADATQTTFQLFKFYGANLRVEIQGVKIYSDCSFAPTGNLYYVRLESSIDPDTAVIDISSVYDDSGDSFTLLGGTLSVSAALKRWHTTQFDHEQRLSNVADDTAVSFTPRMAEGLMALLVDNAPTNSGLFLYRAEAGGAFCELVSGTADLEATTGVLGGTTGTDAKVTVSAHTDGKIYVENRSGAAKTLFLKPLMGIGTS